MKYDLETQRSEITNQLSISRLWCQRVTYESSGAWKSIKMNKVSSHRYFLLQKTYILDQCIGTQ